jgi:hypothetical protein
LLAPVTPNGTTSVDRDTILLIGVEAKAAITRSVALSRSRPCLSIKYNNLNEGKAIAINIKAGEIVQISSRIEP